ncbi:PREDICTED: oleosin GRP-17 [Camelina sativa]|uniref:Oleosin GRP-17 n=1 Tax=Camelina sativa TaxID=90675 RepID=A0ABM0XUX6_CAMSA|nr:PREDICTED: oleosin GRP-17 [Camelina sativa]
MFSFLIPLLEVCQVVIAAVASIVLLGLAGLTFATSAATLTVTTPLFIIFSPILVPATIATAVLASGFTAGGTLGAMAVALIRRRMGVKPSAERTSSTPSVQLKLPIYGGYGGSWGGKTFSGTFGKPFSGNIPAWLKGTPATASGSNPASGAAAPAAGAAAPAAGAAAPAAGSTPPTC